MAQVDGCSSWWWDWVHFWWAFGAETWLHTTGSSTLAPDDAILVKFCQNWVSFCEKLASYTDDCIRVAFPISSNQDIPPCPWSCLLCSKSRTKDKNAGSSSSSCSLCDRLLYTYVCVCECMSIVFEITNLNCSNNNHSLHTDFLSKTHTHAQHLPMTRMPSGHILTPSSFSYSLFA